jgi:hypothetical protein
MTIPYVELTLLMFDSFDRVHVLKRSVQQGI